VPHKQAAHMAAPTEGQNIQNTLANGEPSTHGAKRPLGGPGWNDRFLTQSGHSGWAPTKKNLSINGQAVSHPPLPSATGPSTVNR
jgi:hypothetical protein